MPSRVTTVFACQSCGAASPKWLGRCPECGEWNSYVEEIPEKKLDLRYDPLAIDEDVCVFRSPVQVGGPDEPVVPKEQVDEYLAKVREQLKPQS